LNGDDLVIGDLGHAKELKYGPSSSSFSNKTFGTNNYLAPEADDRLKISIKLDIWSLGCIVYELFNLAKLFNDRDDFKLRSSIRNFDIKSLNTDKISLPKYVTILEK
jgi:serine/threonine protein kinase